MLESQIKFDRVWAMPNKKTFQIQPIRDLLSEEFNHEYLDLFPYPYVMDALERLALIDDGVIDKLAYDPPYSPRQLKECYDDLGLSLHDTTSGVWSKWKKEIARVMKPGGKVISFGWSTNGIGKTLGFDIKRILLVAHGGNHNDTICTVEVKHLDS